jgi:hypothetical protein
VLWPLLLVYAVVYMFLWTIVVISEAAGAKNNVLSRADARWQRSGSAKVDVYTKWVAN